ncbi:MAG: hypothetical protein AABX79_03200 [Nanoarchaeota archaeon]
MREVKGYVFVASFDFSEQIFGQKTDVAIGINYQNLRTNGIKPYTKKSEAKKGMHEFINHMGDVKKARLGKLEMQIAESAKELELFRDKDYLIVIADFDKSQDFFGEIVEKMRRNMGALPGMRITENGFKPLSFKGRSPYERALYILKEINRQGQAPATIATFNLKFIQ